MSAVPCFQDPAGDGIVNANKRPLSITVLAGVYLAVGTVGFVYHLRPVLAARAVHSDDLMVELSEVLAIVAGVFMLRGRNAARWLALAWMAFHVAISFLDSLEKVAVHAVFFAVIAYVLLRPEAKAYFHGNPADQGV